MPHKLKESVVVITGASSGIGRATALAFARRGAAVVLTARREEALRELAEECERLGGRAMAVAADMADEAAVERVARAATERFGRLDVWVNNAAVNLFARMEDTPMDAWRRVIETNVLGYAYGAHAALKRFRAQGSGVLINVSSVVGRFGSPYASAYAASKFAIRGLSTSLRQEQLLDRADIHVCTVLPAVIDTPIYQHAANYMGRPVQAMRPRLDPERVAEAIVGCARRPKREIVVGGAGRLQTLTRTLFPEMAERAVARQVDRQHFRNGEEASPTEGNLFEPMPEYTGVSGGWKKGGGARARRLALAAAGGALLGVLALRPRMERS